MRLEKAFQITKKTTWFIYLNLSWALIYNLLIVIILSYLLVPLSVATTFMVLSDVVIFINLLIFNWSEK
jgi:cation transport ATPase